jgi:hypothetical protein
MLGIVVRTYDPSYKEGIGMRTVIQAGLGKNTRPYLKKNESKKGWRCGSRNTVHA